MNILAQNQNSFGVPGQVYFDNPPAVNPRITNPVLQSGLEKFFNSETNPGVAFLQALLPALISLAFVVGAIIFFFMLLIGAIQWISSGGDKAGLEAAKGKLTAALIGLVVLFSVFAIIQVVETFFGINILVLDISGVVIK